MLKILTLSWNGKDKLQKLYPSLINSLNGIDYKWVIKDNASSDGSVDYIKSLENKNIDIIEYQHNQDSFSLGVNVCYERCKTSPEDYVLLLNNDVVFNDTKSIRKMISIMEKDASVGVVGARLLYSGTNRLQHAGVVIMDGVNLPYHFRAKQISDKNAEENREFQIVTGAVWLTKAKYFEQISDNNKSGLKGLSEDFIWAFDDCDASLSIKYKLNKKVVYCGKTNIFHEESASLKKNPVNKLFMSKNASLFKEKWGKIALPDLSIYNSKPNHNIYNGG